MALISVIVPVYNVEAFLPKCIESILSQSFRNLEVILVDDGSTDASGKICDDYALTDGRIKVFHKQNGGLSDARNYGIDRAHGDYIGFVDSDDWIHPQMYELLFEVLRRTVADICICMYEREDESIADKVYTYSDLSVHVISNTEATIEPRPFVTTAWNKLYKRSIFSEIRYPYGRYHEDEFVMHRIYWECSRIAVIDEPLYFYTIRENSIMGRLNPKRLDDALCAFEDRVDFVKEKKWEGALIPVVEGYCQYCINRYYDIIDGAYDDKSWLDKLWQAAKEMVENNSDIDVAKEYRFFAHSPRKYERLMKRRDDYEAFKQVIKNIIGWKR